MTPFWNLNDVSAVPDWFLAQMPMIVLSSIPKCIAVDVLFGHSFFFVVAVVLEVCTHLN